METKYGRKLFFPGSLGIILVAIISSCHTLIPRQGWNKQWGPLVPHRTFPGDCGICHVTKGWNVLRDDFSFDHAARTGHSLEGAHATAACLRCHNDRGPVAEYLARGCGGCHPDPHASAFGLDCQGCHGQLDWTPTGLIAEHARTRFHLVAAHAVAPCESCHLQAAIGVYRGTPLQCEFCHQRDVAAVVSPNHAANGWTSNCERCHTPAGWAGADFEHYFFPLAGAHAALDCAQCHTGGNYQSISSDCYSCHSDDYTRGPDHVSLSFPQNCEQCHNTSAWSPAFFQHTLFPLAGAHAALDCAQCHTGGVFQGLSSNCYSCHSDDYTRGPDHVSLSFPQNCEQCHNTSAWSPASFQHTFPLTGHHNVNCNLCHTDGSTATFNCLGPGCHDDQNETDNRHNGVSGYSYSSSACFQCHPDGRG